MRIATPNALLSVGTNDQAAVSPAMEFNIHVASGFPVLTRCQILCCLPAVTLEDANTIPTRSDAFPNAVNNADGIFVDPDTSTCKRCRGLVVPIPILLDD